MAAKVILFGAWQQPVDLGLCLLHFGCRYLRVPYTLLMTVNPSTEVLVRLRMSRHELCRILGDGIDQAAL